jgi:predicted phosphodiesterase
MRTIWFCGDVHGEFQHVHQALERHPLTDLPAAVIFLGDLDPEEPLSRIFFRFLDAGIEPWFVHGNHEPEHVSVWQNTLDGWERNLHGRVETIAGLRIAGLGGTFRGEIWYPDHPEMCDPAPKHLTYDDYIAWLTTLQPIRLRAGVRDSGRARQYSAAIFPDVVQELSRQRADVLVTHEAPSCHPNGFATIDRLARAMGVKTLFHGHHHQDLDYGNDLGFEAYQVGLRGIRELTGGIVKMGLPE